LINTFAGYLNKLVGHSNPSLKQPTGGSVPRELPAKIIPRDGDLGWWDLDGDLLASPAVEAYSHPTAGPVGYHSGSSPLPGVESDPQYTND
jgi:hypothetical protein